METNNKRRAFIQKALLGTTSLLAMPFLGRSTKKEPIMSDTTNKSNIRRIRALGFQWETLDPFLFCVHHEDNYPEGNGKMEPNASLAGRHIGQDFILKDGWRMYHGQKIPGFPGHPHRGFETITVVRKGMIDHADSTGAAGRYGDGDVQWMTAGKGVQHSEMFPLIHEDKRNPLELFQIWLNLPRRSKMVEPHFKMFWHEMIPVITEVDTLGSKVTIEVMAGKYKSSHAPQSPPDSWAAVEKNDVAVLNIILEPNATFTLPKAKEGVNRSIYYYEGDALSMDGVTIPHYHAADVNPEAEINIQNGNGTSKLLILQGKPINEPVVQHGPFVMNTKEEIHQAFEDYHSTQFGGWPWPRYDQVHAASEGRFALHSDGTKEMK